MVKTSLAIPVVTSSFNIFSIDEVKKMDSKLLLICHNMYHTKAGGESLFIARNNGGKVFNSTCPIKQPQLV